MCSYQQDLDLLLISGLRKVNITFNFLRVWLYKILGLHASFEFQFGEIMMQFEYCIVLTLAQLIQKIRDVRKGTFIV